MNFKPNCERRTIKDLEFIFKEGDGHFTISTIREDIEYVVKIRKKEKSAFEDFRDHRGGVNGFSYFKPLYKWSEGHISLWYSADVGRCCSTNLNRKGSYSQKFYYNKIDYDYTHDFMIPMKYRKKNFK